MTLSPSVWVNFFIEFSTGFTTPLDNFHNNSFCSTQQQKNARESGTTLMIIYQSVRQNRMLRATCLVTCKISCVHTTDWRKSIGAFGLSVFITVVSTELSNYYVGTCGQKDVLRLYSFIWLLLLCWFLFVVHGFARRFTSIVFIHPILPSLFVKITIDVSLIVCHYLLLSFSFSRSVYHFRSFIQSLALSRVSPLVCSIPFVSHLLSSFFFMSVYWVNKPTEEQSTYKKKVSQVSCVACIRCCIHNKDFNLFHLSLVIGCLFLSPQFSESIIFLLLLCCVCAVFSLVSLCILWYHTMIYCDSIIKRMNIMLILSKWLEIQFG